MKHPIPPRLYVREWRLFRGISQEELARELDIAQAQISNWESGARFPTRENQARIAQALECEYLDLYRQPTRKDQP